MSLFIPPRLNRATETDLGDCVGMLEHCRATGLAMDAARVQGALDALPATSDVGLGGRREALRRLLVGERA